MDDEFLPTKYIYNEFHYDNEKSLLMNYYAVTNAYRIRPLVVCIA